MTDLGPNTERRFAEVFADKVLLTRVEAAALIGVDVKTLSALSDDQVLRAVRRGKVRAYTEHDLRAYLTEGPDVPCRSISRKNPESSPTTSRSKVVAFTARPARLRGVPRKPSSGRDV
jgi:hypothetical protein